MNPVTAARDIVGRNSNALLLVVCLGQFMVILDVSIVNVALPSIKDALGFSTTGLQWVLNAYTLTFAGFLLLGGRAADLFGRRRMFYLGTLLFSGASLLCAIAPTSGALVAARAAQGIGGAILSPATLAIITTSFDEGAPRNRALGAWGAVGAIGATSGVLLGGVLTEAFSWPAIFIINVPIGLAIVLFSSRLIPEGRSEVENRYFDLAGAVLVTLGMTALTYGIVTTDRLGWGSLGVVAPVAAGVALLVAFGLYEAKLASHPRRVPLMPLSVFRLRNLRAANLVIFLLYAAIFGFWFFQSLYMQGTLGYSALETGLAFVPMTAAVGAGATLAPRLAKRFGARWVLAAGMLSATTGEALLIGVHPGGTYLANVLPGGLLGAFGLGLALVPATIVAVEGVPRALSGLASGVLNTSRFVGAALGLAVLSTIAAHHTHSEVASGTSPATALTDGFDLQFAVG
ncbi:MAG TPA: MFS transporter, partial [Solirubrobacterales bacterium]|nr:MFS transporter [Solirubrobacterales bacterium]